MDGDEGRAEAQAKYWEGKSMSGGGHVQYCTPCGKGNLINQFSVILFSVYLLHVCLPACVFFFLYIIEKAVTRHALIRTRTCSLSNFVSKCFIL